jgi:hypothetical protein
MIAMRLVVAIVACCFCIVGCAASHPRVVAEAHGAKRSEPSIDRGLSESELAERRALERAIASWHATPVATSVMSIAIENHVTPIFSAGLWQAEPLDRHGGIRKLLAAQYTLDGHDVYAASSPDVPDSRRVKPMEWFEHLPEDAALYDAERTAWSGVVEPGDHTLVAALVYIDGWCCGYGGACFPTRFVTLHSTRRLHIDPGTATLVRYVGDRDGPFVSDPLFRLDVTERVWQRQEVLSSLR